MHACRVQGQAQRAQCLAAQRHDARAPHKATRHPTALPVAGLRWRRRPPSGSAVWSAAAHPALVPRGCNAPLPAVPPGCHRWRPPTPTARRGRAARRSGSHTLPAAAPAGGSGGTRRQPPARQQARGSGCLHCTRGSDSGTVTHCRIDAPAATAAAQAARYRGVHTHGNEICVELRRQLVAGACGVGGAKACYDVPSLHQPGACMLSRMGGCPMVCPATSCWPPQHPDHDTIGAFYTSILELPK